MGCDIHCYIEFKSPDAKHWKDFGGRINPGRNYWMFGTMAGVRRDDFPHVPPRGVPDDLAYSSSGDYWTFITEDGGDGYCTPAQAESWMKYGQRLQDPKAPLIHNRVSDPDWHSHSWLTADEFELSIGAYLKASGFQINTPRLENREGIEALTTASKEDGNALEYITKYWQFWLLCAALKCKESKPASSSGSTTK